MQIDIVIANVFDYEQFGLQLLADIKSVSPKTSIIIASHQPTADIVISALRHGADDFLIRPISDEDLMRSIDRVIEKRKGGSINQEQLQSFLMQSANFAAIGQLATSVSHEINNPLTIIMANIQLTMAELDPADDQYAMLEDAYYGCQRIKDIVTSLVDLSNQDIYQFEPVNLVETIEETLTLLNHPFDQQNISVVRIYHDAPSIIGSSSHLKTVWMNLLLNAQEAISATQQPGQITVAIDQIDKAQVQVTIDDTGIGIPKDHYGYIFNPLFSTKTEGHGVGLGLFTARTIIEKHQGSLTFESLPNATRFIITLPENPSLA